VSHPDYVFVNESIILPVSFLAKPLPNIEGISWQMHSGDVIRIMHPGDVSITCTALCTALWCLFNPNDKCKKNYSTQFFCSFHLGMSNTQNKVENILKGSLDLIPSPSPPVKIQIMGGKVC
jgi:hypothetical protein